MARFYLQQLLIFGIFRIVGIPPKAKGLTAVTRNSESGKELQKAASGPSLRRIFPSRKRQKEHEPSSHFASVLITLPATTF